MINNSFVPLSLSGSLVEAPEGSPDNGAEEVTFHPYHSFNFTLNSLLITRRLPRLRQFLSDEHPQIVRAGYEIRFAEVHHVPDTVDNVERVDRG